MTIDLVSMLVIIIIAALCWYANEQLNPVPILKNVIRVLIVVISVLMLLDATGLLSTNTRMAIK